MSEHLSITIPRGYGSVQSLADGSLQMTVPMPSFEDYQEMSRAFIGIGVHIMFRGREQYGDLRPEQNTGTSRGES